MNNAERFWSDFEADTGEKVVARSMGIWHEAGNPKGLWGIAILTDKSFRYKYLPSRSLVLGLFRQPNGTEQEREEVDIVAPLEKIESLREEERGFLARLFLGPFRRIELSWREAEGELRTESFSVDPSGGIAGKLHLALSGKAEED